MSQCETSKAEATELMASVGEGVFGKIQRQKVLEQNFSECVGMPKRKVKIPRDNVLYGIRANGLRHPKR